MSTQSRTRRLMGRKVQLTLFSGLTVVFLVITVVLAIKVFSQLNSYVATRTQNLSWTITQLEVEQLKLLTAVNDLEADEASRSVAELRRCFRIFSDLQGLIAAQPTFQPVLEQPRTRAAMRQIATTLETLKPMIQAPQDEVLAQQPQIEAMVRDLSPPVALLSQFGIEAHAAQNAAEQRGLIDRLMQVTWLSLALLWAMLSLLLLLWQLYRLYRKRALENRTTLNRLATILNTSQDAVLVVCPDGGIIDTNHAADTMFFGGTRASGQATIDQVLRRCGPDDTLTPVTGPMLMKSCENGPNLCANLMAQVSDGGCIPVELSADRASRAGGTVVICFIRNISRRMADQAELLAARDTALSGEKAKARFLGMISHEMRTPLNGLIGTLDLLEDTELSDTQARYIRMMQQSGQMLLTQINDALDITQAARGGLTLTPERFDLDALVRSLVKAQTLPASARGNRLTLLDPPAPLGHVIGDPARVHQVLLNLLSNAIKFTRDGQITVEVCRRADDQIEFQITDTGIGIPAQDHSRIFDDFVRLDAARAEAVEGSGLGLGIARHLVELMGGALGVESAPGHGSLFWVHLPLARAEAESATTAEADRSPLPSMDILIVEDNATNRTVLCEMLEQAGHRVWEAENGEQGVALAETRAFDLIIMDIAMPVMDGVEAAARIRAGDGPSRGARLMALSAHVAPLQDSAGAFERVLSKPLRRDTLHAALRGEATPVPARSETLVDQDHLSELRETLGAERVIELIDAFSAEASAVMSALPQMRANPATLASRLHQLAGLAATTGALPFQAALGAAQSALEAGDGIDEALRPLPTLWESTQSDLYREESVA